MQRFAAPEAIDAGGDPTVLPEQLLDSRALSRTGGCYRLLVSVLETAVDDCIRRPRRPEGMEAEEWIFSRETRSALPFLTVCDALDLDPDAVRRRIRAWRAVGMLPSRLHFADD